MRLPVLGALLVASLTAALSSQAQVPSTVVPDSGCPGSAGLWLTGSNQIGGTLTVQCNTPTASTGTWTLVGTRAPVPWLLPASLSCWPGCKVGVDPAHALGVLGFTRTPVPVPIPNDPNLVGTRHVFQCVESIFSSCFQVSLALEVTIQ